MTTMQRFLHFSLAPFPLRAAALATVLALAACGGDDSPAPAAASSSGGGAPAADNYVAPGAPAGLGHADSAAPPTVTLAYADDVAASTNVAGDACHATVDTNAGVHLLQRLLDVWTPRSLFVDATVTTAITGCGITVNPTDWTGDPTTDIANGTSGTFVNAAVHARNISYVETATANRTAAQAQAAYLDDRRNKGFSVTDGMGPLTDAYRSAAQAAVSWKYSTTVNQYDPGNSGADTTTVQSTDPAYMPADAATKLYDDKGTGFGASGAAGFDRVISALNTATSGTFASGEPTKRFYKYPRPWRWSSVVQIAPTLLPARGATAKTDGGFPSGHTAEGTRDAIALAYMVPQRFQEMIARGLELGENRIIAGMHSPMDVMGGRILGTAAGTSGLYALVAPADRQAAYNQAQTALQTAANVSSFDALLAKAHSGTTDTDRFADHDANKKEYLRRLTFGFSQIGDKTKAAVVPKGAEVLLETRFPYLTNDQRRVVLKTTALPSGYPVLDDDEGWGRLNLFDAGDGYGNFNGGDVSVTMDASLGGFSARDTWRNDIGGAGKLTKNGSGALALAGANTYSGGTDLEAGVLEADSGSALGSGAVYVGGGSLVVKTAKGALAVQGTYTQAAAGTLEVHLDGTGAGTLAAGAPAALAGTLAVKFKDGYTPKAGDTLTVLTASAVHGKFDAVTVDGFKATPVYSGGSVQVALSAN